MNAEWWTEGLAPDVEAVGEPLQLGDMGRPLIAFRTRKAVKGGRYFETWMLARQSAGGATRTFILFESEQADLCALLQGIAH